MRFPMVAAALALAACGGSDGSGRVAGDASDTSGSTGDVGPVTGDPFDLDRRAGELAAANCAYRERCEPVLFPYLGQTRVTCESEQKAAIASGWAALTPFLEAARVAFDADALDRCIRAETTDLVDCDVGPDPRACDGIFFGARGVGAACGISSECASGYCDTAALGGCGRCQARAAVGADCALAPCVDGASCFTVDAQGTRRCAPTEGEIGATCGTLDTGICRGHLQCVGPLEGPFTCARPAAAGATCDKSGVAPDCDLYAIAVCGDAKTCVALAVVGPPSACGEAGPGNLCNAASRCDTASGKCVALGVAGSACDEDFRRCGAGFYCPAAGTCAEQKADGVTCQADGECRSGFCIDATCGPFRADATCR